MRTVYIDDVLPGMMIAESIYNHDYTVELLSKHMVLKDNHIDMLRRRGITEVLIVDQESLNDQNISKDQMIKGVGALTPEGRLFNEQELSQLIDDLGELDYDQVTVSLCNQNMEIAKLTGEGNLPLDVVHHELIEETRHLLDAIKTGEPIEVNKLKDNIQVMLPDMIKNNDVLMRLKQMESGDDYTFKHALRVSTLAAIIGKWLGYDRPTLEELALSGLLFDIGKLQVPDHVLNYPGLLSEEAFEVVKKHSQWGYQNLLKTPGLPQGVKFAALQHHERLDGSGYPLRVKTEQLHIYSKIIMVCDVFDALIHDRCYKNKVSAFYAAEYLSLHSGSLFDATVVYVLLKNLSEYYLGKTCTLSSGEVGRIVYVDPNYLTRPIVNLDNRFIDLSQTVGLNITEIE